MRRGRVVGAALLWATNCGGSPPTTRPPTQAVSPGLGKSESTPLEVGLLLERSIETDRGVVLAIGFAPEALAFTMRPGRVLRLENLQTGRMIAQLESRGITVRQAIIEEKADRLALMFEDGYVAVYDLEGKPITTFQTPGGGRMHLIGQLLLTFSSRSPLVIWDRDTGKLLATPSLLGHVDGLWQLTASGSRFLVRSRLDTRPGTPDLFRMELWDLLVPRRVAFLQGSDPDSPYHTFPPSFADRFNEHSLITTDLRATYLWSTESGRLIAEVGHRVLRKSQTLAPTAAALSPNGTLLVLGYADGQIHQWDGTSGKPLGVLADMGSRIHALAFSRDSTHLAGSYHGGGRVWQLGPARERSQFSQGVTPGDEIQFSLDGKHLVVQGSSRWAGNKSATVVRTATGEPVVVSSDHVKAVHFSEDGQYVAMLPWVGGAWVARVSDGRKVGTAGGVAFGCSAVGYAGSGSTLGCAARGELHLVDVETGAVRRACPAESTSLGQRHALVFDSTGKFASRGAAIRNIDTCRWLAPKTLDSARFADVAFEVDGPGLLVVGPVSRDQKWRVAKLSTPSSAPTTLATGSVYASVSWGGHDTIVAGTPGGRVDLLSPTSPPRALGQLADSIYTLAVSSDGVHVAAGTASGEVALWNASSGHQMLHTVAPSTEYQSRVPTTLAFNGSKPLLAALRPDGTLTVVELGVSGALLTLGQAPAYVTSFTFTADEQYLAVSYASGTCTGHGFADHCACEDRCDIELFSTARFESILREVGDVEPVTHMAADPRGDRIATRSSASLRFWRIIESSGDDPRRPGGTTLRR